MKVAREARTWGYRRICGVVKNLGFEISPNTIKRILLDHGIDPAMQRGKQMGWRSTSSSTEIRDLEDVGNVAEDRTSESGDRLRKYGKCSRTQA